MADEGEFHGLAYEWFKEGRYNQAAELLRVAVKIFPGSPALYDRLGQMYELLGRAELAAESYKRSGREQ